MLVEFENVFLIVGIFLQLGAKNYFWIEKISYFGNYMDPWYICYCITGVIIKTSRSSVYVVYSW